MPNIALILRDEIMRISRRENKKQIAVLLRSSASYRRDIARIKRELQSLQREVKTLRDRKNEAVVPPNEKIKSRFVAKGFRSLRRRLGLTAGQMAKLLQVSPQSIYNWETKIATPRVAQLPAIARLRSMGKREAHRLLSES